jgi:hypothetical protein
MHIEERTLFNEMTCFIKVCEDCPKCGREMTEIMFYGEVCVFCDSSKNQETDIGK